MDPDNPSDIYVAPLHITKAVEHVDPTPNETQATCDGQPMTATVQTSHDDTIDEEDQSHPIFQNYLRAVYPFAPAASLSPSTVTLSLNAGDLVLVHSVHTNGWADGTLLDNGARGWLPTNYCEAYERIAMRPLLKGLTEFWDLIRTGSISSLDVFANQDYMRGLIAGVRFLLERSDCLTRDSALIRSHDGLRKSRKALLSDLSLLVKAAKRLQELVLAANNSNALDETLDDMLLKAFKIVIRGVRFLEIWTEALPTAAERIPAHQDGFVASTPPPDAISIDHFPSSTAMHSNSQRQPHDSGTSFSSTRSHRSRLSSQGQRISLATRTPAAPGSDRRPRPSSLQFKRQSVTHRMSYSGQPAGRDHLNLASDQLSRCYDTFLGVLASFLGSHLQSRSSSELLLTTQYAVKSCRELLAVVEFVIEHDGGPADMLLVAKDAMYDRITELVHAARDVFRPTSSADEDSIFLPDDGKHLLNAATACVRVAGDCVAQTRLVLEQIGDFELSPSTQCSSIMSAQTEDSPVLPREQFAPPPSSARWSNAPRHAIIPTSQARPRIDIPSTIVSTPDLVISSVPSSAIQAISMPSTPALIGAETHEIFHVTFTSEYDGPADQTHEAVQLKRQKSLARNIIRSTGSDSTYVSSVRDSQPSVISATSTRATSPDIHSLETAEENMESGFSDSQTTLTKEIAEAEAKLLEKTFAQELMFNKEGQVIGGSLNALVERLTAHDSTPDALFVSTFYLTFRLFVPPQKFAGALAARFEYVADTPQIAAPVRLRVYNVFKGWLESHWRHDCDDSALPDVVGFARNVLAPVLPAAGARLLDLTMQVSLVSSPLVPRVAGAIGRTNTSIAQYVNPDSPIPEPIISRSQLLALRTWKMGGAAVSVVDFDPLELARQITIKVSSLFCCILPEELLATEWTKRSGSLAVNVRAMSTLSTDITNLVADSILQLEDPKKRAVTIKQWVKIANKCMELNNFDTLMAIICSLNSTTILRLKKTWDIVSQKTKSTLESLSKVVEFSRNHVVLRQRLQNIKPPCMPFVGMYLTDLTFVDHGNQMTRQLSTETGTLSLINFDKHMKTAKIISDLQRFQIPYRLTEVPELQTWMQDQLIRVRSAEEATFQSHYRRSLILEPREQASQTPSPIDGVGSKEKERFDFLAWTHITKEKSIVSHS